MADRVSERWVRLLARLLPRRYREDVVADLVEERAAQIARGTSAYRAHGWLAAHLIRSAVASRRAGREVRGPRSRWLRDIGRDGALGIRLLMRQPRFTATALLTLAIGIGAPSAVFSVVHGVLIQPLPYRDADRLVQFRMEARGPAGPISFAGLPASTAIEWAAGSSTLSALALYNTRALTLSSTSSGPTRLTGIQATADFFDVLGSPAAMGRTFDAAMDNVRPIVLSHETWQQHFGGDRAIVGSTVVLDSEPYLVAGVMPARFDFPTPDAAFWTPLVLDAGGSRGMILPAIARLADGATTAGATDEGQRALVRAGHGRDEQVSVRTLQDQMTGSVRRLLWVLMAAVSFVFVIATTNIALLLLTRGAGREREFSVRLALGASRARLARQLMIESLVLAGLGGVAGLGTCALALGLLPHLAPADLPRLRDVALDARVVIFAFALTGCATVIVGALSAARAMGTDPGRALGRLGGDARLSLTRTTRRRLGALAASEIALTTVLIVGAALLVKSFAGLLLVDHGFGDRDALAVQINLPSARYPTAASRVAFHERLLERLAAIRDIDAVGLTVAMPNRQPSARMIFSSAPVPMPFDPMTTPVTETRSVSEGFFDAMGIPIRAGREFLTSDRAGANPVLVISDRLAAQQFPGRPAVGETMYTGAGDLVRVVGVVGDVRPAAPGADVVPAAYTPFRQDEMVFEWFATVTVIARASNLETATASIRRVVTSLDPEMPVFGVRTLHDELWQLTAGPRFSASLVGSFAVVACVLAAIGVFGVMAHSAELRMREIGVRLALGATRRQVVGLVFRDGLRVMAIGLGVGLVAATWLARALTGLLYEVRPADPVALTSVALVLSLAGALAAYLPARRATRVSTTVALGDR